VQPPTGLKAPSGVGNRIQYRTMREIEKIDYGKFYHIYNCGVNGENIFLDNDNYEYFLRLYDKNVTAVADTFAWCLMKNHFHFLVRIKEESEIASSIQMLTPDGAQSPVGVYYLPQFNFQRYSIRMPKHSISETEDIDRFLSDLLKESKLIIMVI